MTWDELKQNGSSHYKTGDVEPIDLYKSGGALWDFCICSIIKYAYRNRREQREQPVNMNPRDIDKIQHYCEMLRVLQSESMSDCQLMERNDDI